MKMISDRTRIMLKFLVPQRRKPNLDHAIAAHPEARDVTKRAKLMEHSERALARWLADADPVKVTP